VADAPDRAFPVPPEVAEIAETLEAAGHETWAVGGVLRDWLLGEPWGELDLATAAPPETVRRLFPRTVPVGLKHGTVGVLDRRRRLHEVTTFRRDVETDGRHAVVSFGVSLEEDLARRDFTINAIAYHIRTGRWADPFGGQEDLKRGLIRAVGDPTARFREDYLRILRALRFATRYGFEIDPATWNAMQQAARGLDRLSAERVRDEWFKGLRGAQSLVRYGRLWREAGAAAVWLPELRDPYPGTDRPPSPRDPVILTVVACEAPARVLLRLRASGQEIERAQVMDAAAPAPEGTTPVQVRGWLREVGAAADDLHLLAAAREGVAPAWAPAVAQVRRRGEATSRNQLALKGEDLIALGVAPGPGLGALLDRLLDAVIDDPSLNTRGRLSDLVAQWR